MTTVAQSQPDRTLLVQLYEGILRLTPQARIATQSSNLPPIAHHFTSPASWQCRIIHHDIPTGHLHVEIQSYHKGSLPFSSQQLQQEELLMSVKHIHFKHISTGELLRTLDRQPSKLPTTASGTAKRTGDDNDTLLVQPETWKERFTIPLKDLQFGFGEVKLYKKFRGISEAVAMTIRNDHIRAEFDAIKNYFEQALNRKKINVQAVMSVLNGEVVEVHAVSKEIDLIDVNAIQAVRLLSLKKALTKAPQIAIDKALFTSDDFLSSNGHSVLYPKAFHASEKDLFEDILHVSKCKHYRHLRLLAAMHNASKMKLRFVHSPLSFLFLITRQEFYYLIWETLDTEEATYIWRTRPNKTDAQREVKRIEEIIQTIRVHGKTAYVNQAEESFLRIKHDYSAIADGFVKWKSQLEAVLR